MLNISLHTLETQQDNYEKMVFIPPERAEDMAQPHLGVKFLRLGAWDERSSVRHVSSRIPSACRYFPLWIRTNLPQLLLKNIASFVWVKHQFTLVCLDLVDEDDDTLP